MTPSLCLALALVPTTAPRLRAVAQDDPVTSLLTEVRTLSADARFGEAEDVLRSRLADGDDPRLRQELGHVLLWQGSTLAEAPDDLSRSLARGLFHEAIRSYEQVLAGETVTLTFVSAP